MVTLPGTAWMGFPLGQYTFFLLKTLILIINLVDKFKIVYGIKFKNTSIYLHRSIITSQI
jgi:hypothetical protein